VVVSAARETFRAGETRVRVGHGEGLRRNRGEAAGAASGQHNERDGPGGQAVIANGMRVLVRKYFSKNRTAR